MMFSIVASALVFAISANAAPALEARGNNYGCLPARDIERAHKALHPWIQQLYSPCIAPLRSTEQDFWKNRACAAAAVAFGPSIIVDYGTCDKADIPKEDELPNFDYGIYASITGDCAYDSKACSISKQNLVDLVYSELSKSHANVYPDNATELVEDFIAPIFTWAGRNVSQGLPYSIFNSFLHTAPYPTIITDDAHPSGRTYYYERN